MSVVTTFADADGRGAARSGRLIGIGYEGLAIDAYLDLLEVAGVEVVVDVRLNAISRKAGFSKRALSSALAAAGIEYRHDRRLGNPRENRPAFALPGSLEGNAARARYREMLEGIEGQAAVSDLSRLVAARTVALLCFEAEESCCHRQQIIDVVPQRQGSRSNSLTDAASMILG